MSRDRMLVRASDIGLWAYCHRAWWLARVHKAPHRYPERLAHGTAVHETHGRVIVRAQRAQQWARILLALGVLLLGIALVLWLVQSPI